MTEFPREAQTHRLTRRPARAAAAAGLAASALLLGACTSSGGHSAGSTGTTGSTVGSASPSAPATGASGSAATSGGSDQHFVPPTASAANHGRPSGPSTLPGNHNALIYYNVTKQQSSKIQNQVGVVSGVQQILYYADASVLEVDLTNQATANDRKKIEQLVAQNLK